MSTAIAAELRALADEPDSSLAHVQKLRDHLLLAADALEAPLQPKDPWRDERHLFGGAYAKVTRILSRETKLEVSIAGTFDQDGVEKVIAALRNAGHVEDRPLLSVEEIEQLRRVRHYFEDRWPNIGEPPDARDARRYRRLRILGARVVRERDELSDVKRFQNLDELVDRDLYHQPGRGEVRDNLAVDWNDQAKAVLSKVIALHSMGQV